MTMITPSYLGETIEYSSLHACRSTLEDPTYGEVAIAEHFRSFDTICSATQERQDAVVQLLAEPIDMMLVIGGYNSSNTCALAALAESHGIRTYHIEDAENIDVASQSIRHQPVRSKQEVVESGWLGSAARIGVTAGASTPNNKIGETVARVTETAGERLQDL